VLSKSDQKKIKGGLDEGCITACQQNYDLCGPQANNCPDLVCCQGEGKCTNSNGDYRCV
jgi:hypothetical protein